MSLKKQSVTSMKLRTNPSRGNNTSALAGSAISQTTGVCEVTSEALTSGASVEAPRNTLNWENVFVLNVYKSFNIFPFFFHLVVFYLAFPLVFPMLYSTDYVHDCNRGNSFN